MKRVTWKERTNFAPTIEEKENNIEKKTGRAFIPYSDTKKRLNYMRIQKEALVLFTSQKYDQFNTYFASYSLQERENFFKERGKIFFSWALIEATDVKPLETLLRLISNNISTQILSNENFGLLARFIDGQKVMEQYQVYNTQNRGLAIAKIKTLLAIENIPIKNFIESNLSENLKKTFETILPQKQSCQY